MKITSILRFYRILGWKEKMTGLGALGYAIFGYILAKKFYLLPFIFDLLVVFFGTLFAFSINNYYDWQCQGEKNFIGENIEKGKISKNLALFFCFLPAFLGLFILGIALKFNLISTLSASLLSFLFLLTFFYAFPPLRLKEKKFFGFFAVPLGNLLIFLQGFFLFGRLYLNFILLTVLFFFFEIYIEILHVLDDSLMAKEYKKLSSQKALKLLKIVPLFSIFLSFCFSFHNPLFLNTAVFSFLRLFSLRNFKIEMVHQIRRNLFSLSLSFYEFFLYGLFSFFGLI